eukprot:1721460-Amphidinium_carterae.1
MHALVSVGENKWLLCQELFNVQPCCSIKSVNPGIGSITFQCWGNLWNPKFHPVHKLSETQESFNVFQNYASFPVVQPSTVSSIVQSKRRLKRGKFVQYFQVWDWRVNEKVAKCITEDETSKSCNVALVGLPVHRVTRDFLRALVVTTRRLLSRPWRLPSSSFSRLCLVGTPSQHTFRTPRTRRRNGTPQKIGEINCSTH